MLQIMISGESNEDKSALAKFICDHLTIAGIPVSCGKDLIRDIGSELNAKLIAQIAAAMNDMPIDHPRGCVHLINFDYSPSPFAIHHPQQKENPFTAALAAAKSGQYGTPVEPTTEVKETLRKRGADKPLRVPSLEDELKDEAKTFVRRMDRRLTNIELSTIQIGNISHGRTLANLAVSVCDEITEPSDPVIASAQIHAGDLLARSLGYSVEDSVELRFGWKLLKAAMALHRKEFGLYDSIDRELRELKSETYTPEERQAEFAAGKTYDTKEYGFELREVRLWWRTLGEETQREPRWHIVPNCDSAESFMYWEQQKPNNEQLFGPTVLNFGWVTVNGRPRRAWRFKKKPDDGLLARIDSRYDDWRAMGSPPPESRS